MPLDPKLINKPDRSQGEPEILNGIISPCTGCRNNIPVPTNLDDAGVIATIDTADSWPCPKKLFYAQYRADLIKTDPRYTTLIYDQSFKHVNPVWPGATGVKDGKKVEYNNGYAVVFVATYKDNSDTYGNIAFDSEYIRCRGPYLIGHPERWWNFLGHLNQRDVVIVQENPHYVDGIQFRGFVTEGAVWQMSKGYLREIDTNLGISFSGAF